MPPKSDPNRYDTKVIEITLIGYDWHKVNALLNAIGDADPANANIETKALSLDRVEIPHHDVMTAASNGAVDTYEIRAAYDDDPLRTARILGALVGVADMLKSVNLNSGRTFR